MAFAGVWPPKKSDGTRWTEPELGWTLCNGANNPNGPLLKGDEYKELREVLGSDKRPDYQDYFLRGASEGRTIGSPQEHATAIPRKAFETNETGFHNHVTELETMASRNPGDPGMHPYTVTTHPTAPKNSLGTNYTGKHNHTIISGGDDETGRV
jgi:hypothetical protein